MEVLWEFPWVIQTNIIWLGITLALTWLSGQGYLQIAIVFGILPPFLIFLLRDWHNPDALWKPFLLALAVLVGKGRLLLL